MIQNDLPSSDHAITESVSIDETMSYSLRTNGAARGSAPPPWPPLRCRLIPPMSSPPKDDDVRFDATDAAPTPHMLARLLPPHPPIARTPQPAAAPRVLAATEEEHPPADDSASIGDSDEPPEAPTTAETLGERRGGRRGGKEGWREGRRVGVGGGWRTSAHLGGAVVVALGVRREQVSVATREVLEGRQRRRR